jgi:hypothetical protein
MADALTTVEGFTARFASDIRVQFNWHRFADERWPIELVEAHSPDQLAAIEVPLCVDAAGRTCGLGDSGARRVTVAEIPELLDQLGPRADYIREQSEQYQAVGAARDQLPGYGLERGAILMDGVHRSAGALLAEVPIEIDLYIVGGPLDSDCLADLQI